MGSDNGSTWREGCAREQAEQSVCLGSYNHTEKVKVWIERAMSSTDDERTLKLLREALVELEMARIMRSGRD